MHERFNITLPLILGANSLRKDGQHQKQFSEVVSSTDIECSLVMKTTSLFEVDQNDKKIKGKVSKVSYNNNLLQAELSVSLSSESTSNKEGELSRQMDVYNDIFPFAIELKREKDILIARITKLQVTFKLHHVYKPKFVKNEHLQNLNSSNKSQSHEWGLLTMDQSQRIVIEAQTTNFPAIGFWSFGKSRHETQFLRQLVDYCNMKLTKKCKFVSNCKKYFYFARFSSESKTPELFLVEWSETKDNIILLEYPFSDLKAKQQIVLRSDEHSHLEFTLRSDQKVPQKLLDIKCSPVLFKDSPSTNISQDDPDSPRFKTQSVPSSLQKQCATLKKIVQRQQEEINKLRNQLLRFSLLMDLQNPTTHMKTIVKQDNGKFLTQKDLSIGAPSSDAPSTNSSSHEEEHQWEKFELVENNDRF